MSFSGLKTAVVNLAHHAEQVGEPLDAPALARDFAQAVSDTFFTRFKGKTIVTVTHELNFIAGADQIVVMDQGRIVGRGIHRELMESCPVYRKLVEEQSYQEVFAQ